MSRNDTTSAMIDGLLKFLATGGLLGTAVLAPNAVRLWDKPARQLFKKLDNRAQEREYRRLVSYMKQRRLIKYDSDDYEHGLVLTAKGRQRAEHTDIHRLSIPTPAVWDGNWRIVLFDIPEKHKVQRNLLSRILRRIGCEQLQRSVWIYPFPFREQLQSVAVTYELEKYVTYMETNYIDAEDKLIERFTSLHLKHPTSR